MKTKNNEKRIAVIGATGQQGGAVARAVQASGQFKVRALSRNPAYLGSDSSDRIALANKIAGRQPTRFSTWARVSFPVRVP